MTLHYWDGTPDSLSLWLDLAPDDRPLVIVEPDYPKHLIESRLKNHLLESISIQQIFSKFHANVVKELPKENWDELFNLHQEERAHRTPEETAVLISRAFYGADPLFLTFGNGWPELLHRVAASGRVFPITVARTLLERVESPPYLPKEDAVEVLTEHAVARSRVTALLHSNKEFATAAKISLGTGPGKVSDGGKDYSSKPSINWLGQWEAVSKSPTQVLKFALEYGAYASTGDVGEDDRHQMSQVFLEWLRQNYSYAMTSSSPEILKLHTLVRQLDQESADQPLLIVVVDALGVESWYAISAIWRDLIGYKAAHVRGAFAILPTITTLSRRAFFEGKMPSQFGPGEHSQEFERRAWKARFGEDGGYFTPSDSVKLDHAFARKTKRIVIVDTFWDSMGHAILPQADSISAAARRWCVSTPLTGILKSALDNGYKVVITADHGQIACTGSGRPNFGSLPEHRHKRAIVFQNDALLQSYASHGITDFRPYGLGQNEYVMFARELESFDLPGVQGVSHGGLTIEEAIVPVVEVTR